MSKSNSAKHGFPVLAYLTSQPLSLPFTLRIQHHEPRKQVTLMLRTCVSLHGADDEQAFVAQYDADNLLPDTGEATVYMPATRLAKVVRNSNSPQITKLSLRLKNACPLWCPRIEALLPKPEPTHVEAFHELVQLAKAKTVHVVFDYHWLSLDARVPFQRIVKGKEALTGFPVGDYYSRFYRPADWTVFGPELDSRAPNLEEASSNKRPRRVSSPPSSPPPYKRKIVEHEQAPSPTELATSPATVKSYCKDGYAAEKSIDDERDFQTRAITRVVQRHLPAVLADVLPAALKQVLPEVLPAILPALFALPASFTASYDSSSLDSDSSHDRSPQTSVKFLVEDLPPYNLRPSDLTPLGASLLPHVLAHVQPQLQKMHARSLARGVHRLHRDAALKLEEEAEGYKTELAQVRDDGFEDLQQEAEYRLDKVREMGRYVAEEVGIEVEDVVRARAERALRDVRRAVKEAALQQESREVRPRGHRRVGKGGYRGVQDRKWSAA